MSRRLSQSLTRGVAVVAAVAMPLAGLAIAQTPAGAAPSSVQPRVSAYPTTNYAVVKTIGVLGQAWGIAVDSSDDTVYVATRPTLTTGLVQVIDGKTGVRVGSGIPAGNGAGGIAVNDQDDTVYVANVNADSLSVISGLAGAAADTLPVGDGATAVAVHGLDDTVYVANSGGNSVSVLNGRFPRDDSSVFAVGLNPRGIAVNDSDDTVYVTLNNAFAGNTLYVSGLSPVTVGTGPVGVAVNQSDDTIYVGNSGNPANSGSVLSVLNGRAPASGATSVTVGAGPNGVAVDQTDDTVYVANFTSSSVSVVSGGGAASLDDTVMLPSNSGPFAIAVDDSGVNRGLVYTANIVSNNVAVIGRATPISSTSAGIAGNTVTVSLTVPALASGFVMDDSTIEEVKFGSATGTSLTRVAGQNQWTVTVPAGTPGSTVDVDVKLQGGLWASSGTFTYSAAPTVTGISPSSGSTAGGTTVTITGTNFVAGASVAIGGVTCGNVTVVTSTSITCTTAARTAGLVDVVVTNPGPQVGTGVGLYTYVTPPPPPPPADPPSPPRDVTATAGNRQATVAWVAPLSAGSLPIASYVATASPGGQTCSIAWPALTCMISGLTNGTAYTVTVRALSDAGSSESSAPSRPVTPTSAVTYSTPGLYMCTVDGEGIQTIPFTVKGGKGGTGNEGTLNGSPAVPNAGGLGASVSGSFDVAAGTKLALTVGSNGLDAGARTDGESAAGGGGGYSSISLQPTSDPVVVAGGGGGGSYFNASTAVRSADRVERLRAPRAAAALAWTGRTTPATGWGNIVYAEGVFVAVRNAMQQPGAMTSTDGITWTGHRTPTNAAGAQAWDHRGIAYGNGTFIAVGTGGRTDGATIIRSSDKGQTWTRVRPPASADLWSIAYGGGKFVVVGRTGSVIVSEDDGLTWRQVTAPAREWRDVTYGDGLFVAVSKTGTGNRVMTSPDGINWTSRQSAADNVWEAVTYGNGLFVAVAQTGTDRVMTSPDGITWTARATPLSIAWSGVTYGENQFVAVSVNGTGTMVMTSPDGITWTAGTPTPGTNWVKVAYGDGKFVAVSIVNRAPAVMTSGPILPAAPTITSTVPGNSSGTINFTPPANAALAGVTNYEYQLDGGAWVTLSPASASSPFTITELANRQTYTVRIRAIGAGGVGPASAPATVTPNGPAGPFGGKGGNAEPTNPGVGGGEGGRVGLSGKVGGTLASPGAGGTAGSVGGPGGNGGAVGTNGVSATVGSGGGGGGGFGAIGGAGSATDADVATWSPGPAVYGAGGGGGFDGGGGGGGYAGGGGGAGGAGTAGAGGGGGGSSLLITSSTGQGITNKVDGTLAVNSTAPSVTAPHLICSFGVRYVGNGNTAGTVPTDSSWYAEGSTVTAAGGASLRRGADYFSGWATTQFGPPFYGPGASIGPLTGPVTLWATYGPQKTVTFDANDGTGTMAPQKSAAAEALVENTFTREGYAFSGWNTEADGNGKAYDDEATYAFVDDATLYAQWALLKTVTFDANGGTGTMEPQKGGVPEALNFNSFTRSGDVFLTWNTRADGSGTSYDNGGSYTFESDITLYAQWIPMPSTAPQPIPAPIPPGGYVFQNDGQVTPIVLEPNPGGTGVVVDDTGWTMTLQGLGANNAPLALTPSGTVILEVERNARTTGTGFLAQSRVALYMDPQVTGGSTLPTIELGSATVRLDGSFDFTKPLPAEIKPGNHVIQSVGYGPRGEMRTLSIGVVVQPWISLDQGTRKPAGLHDRMSTTGDSAGIDPGVRLTPWITYVGQKGYKQGQATIILQSNGTFTWTRLIKKSKGMSAYVSWTDIKSNKVFWAKVR